MVDIKEAEKIIDEIKSGNWEEFIKLQTNPYREYYHAELLKNILGVCWINQIFSKDLIENEIVYQVVLIRYFGTKPFNNGFYFRKKEDAENFVKQYIEIMASNSFLEREDGEKIMIIGMELLSVSNVI